MAKARQAVLDQWIAAGIAYHADDGAWAWTDKGKKMSSELRTCLMWALYGQLDSWNEHVLLENGFEIDGSIRKKSDKNG